MSNESNQRIIFEAVRLERLRQDKEWGIQNHPQKMWIVILGKVFGKICGAISQSNRAIYRVKLVQIAAVAIAAIESFDRKS